MRDATRRTATDTVPLTQRVWAMILFRLASAGALLAVGLTSDRASAGAVPLLGLYIAVTSMLSLMVLTRSREATVMGFGMTLLIDSLYLAYQRHLLGDDHGLQLVLGAFMVAVCLLASFRTGIKIAVWQSLLLLMEFRAVQSELIGPGPSPLTGEVFLSQLGLLWLLVLTTSSAAAISERELRRRRYDAEALQAFAANLHGAQRPADVSVRLLRFAVKELDASRALICRRSPRGIELVVGHGITPIPPGVPASSALLDLPARTDVPALALRLDPGRDPWVDAALPQARRLVTFRLHSTNEAEPTFLIMEHSAQRGSRVERRLLTTASQAAATAALALSRADLLEQARVAATTDGLTGVLNRRSFDEALADLVATFRRGGKPFSLIMVDVDRFKSVNDTYGHQMGDRVLQVVARTLVAGGAEVAQTARYGGEEFAVLVPGLRAEEAWAVAERMRLLLHDAEGVVPITASFGVASIPQDAGTGHELIELADGALMRAKQTGRDRVVLAAGLKQGLAAVPSPQKPAQVFHAG